MFQAGGELRRVLSTPVLTAYGVGTIVGAGIYALVGKIAGMAGYLAPLSFLGAALIAFLTALSYGELAARYPKAAGEALYVFEGISSKHLAVFAGLLVIASGVFSSAALVIGVSNYFTALVHVPHALVVIGVTLLLTVVAAIGVVESVSLVVGLTLIEVGGLLYIIFVGWDGVDAYFAHAQASLTLGDDIPYFGIFAGMILSFYAFIGFEDMVNMAEETKDTRRSMGVAIVSALVITTVLYVLIVIISLGYMTPEALKASKTPLADIFHMATGKSVTLILLISTLAIINGALVQVVMASRVLYGMARQGWLPEILGRVHPKTHTPLVATLVVSLLYYILSSLFLIETLAKFSAMMALIVFAMVNLALVSIKVRTADNEAPAFHVPTFVPLWGFMACAGCAVLEGLWRVQDLVK